MNPLVDLGRIVGSLVLACGGVSPARLPERSLLSCWHRDCDRHRRCGGGSLQAMQINSSSA